MNSNVHPLIVALVLVLTGLAVGIWMWGSGAAANIGGPAEMKVDARGHAFVQIQDQLVEHDANGKYLKTHDLGDMDVETFLGSFDFFSNGDILMRRGADPRSLSDNIRAYRRQLNKDSIVPNTPDSGLFRCSLESKQCRRFGESGLDFKASHGLFIDRSTDDVYISDTTRHVLRKYSWDGVALAEPVGGFKFPNQLLIHADELYVADTNHHEIRIVDPATESFGVELGRKSVAPNIATAAGQIWPSHLVRVAGAWWVNNMRNGMNQGAIYIFDDNWQLIRKLALPEGADPIALLSFSNEVWISDWYNDKVHRFSTSGESLADLNSAGLNEVLRDSASERQKFEMISYSGIGLILLVLGGLAVRGLAVVMSGSATIQNRSATSAQVKSRESVLNLEPNKKALKRMTWVLNLMILMLVVIALILTYIVGFYGNTDFAMGMILPAIGMLFTIVFFVWVNRSNIGTAIRIDGSTVTLRDHTGRESSCAITDVRYDETAIATQDVVVFLGRPMAYIYDRKELKEELLPRLTDVPKVTPWEMQTILIRQQHPQGIAVVLAVVAVVIYAAWTFSK